jgi:hypothetical protein
MKPPNKAMGSMQNYSYILWLAGINVYGFSIHTISLERYTSLVSNATNDASFGLRS